MNTKSWFATTGLLLLASTAAIPGHAADELAAHPAVRIEAAGGWGGINLDPQPRGFDGIFDGGVFRGAASATQRFGPIALQLDLNGTVEDFGMRGGD